MTREERDEAAVFRALRRKHLASKFKSNHGLPEVLMPHHMTLPARNDSGRILRVSEREHWTYFLQGDDAGPIKIGSTYGDPRQRRDDVQIGYPFGRLQIIGLIRGPRNNERTLHARFRHLRMRGEWFTADAELTRFISALPPLRAYLGRRARSDGDRQ